MKHRAGRAFSLAVLLLLPLLAAVAAADDIHEHRSCKHCGMDRKAYGFSRMLVQHDDGSSAGLCSLRCAVLELDTNSARTVKAVLVADRSERTLLDAKTAFWVMGGAKRGVMTSRPKWAFATRAAAETFIENYGGSIVRWEEALSAAREDLASEAR